MINFETFVVSMMAYWQLILLVLIFSLKGSQSQVACICDLKVGVCEINCCCDTDCSEADVATFSFCLDTQLTTVEEKCISLVIQHINNLPDLTLGFKNGLSCVTFDNLLSENQYTKPISCNNSNVCSDLLPFLQPQVDQNLNTSINSTYKSGNPIYTLSNTSVIGELRIPSAFLSGYCDKNNPIEYLFNHSNSCIVNMNEISDCETTNILQTAYYVNNFRVYSQLKFANLIPPSLDGLLDVVTSCIDETSGLEVDCSISPVYDSVTNSCKNIVTSIDYLIETNDTSEIFQVGLSLSIGSLNSTNFPINLKSSVGFVSLSSGSSLNPDFKSNLGYIFGSTILSNGNYVLDLIKVDVSKTCSSLRTPIYFGNDMRTSCIQNFQTKTECSTIQNNLLAILKGDNFLGNNTGNITDSSFLIPQYKGSSSIASSSIEEDPIADGIDLVSGCSNIAVGLKYEILYASNGSVGNSQTFIVSVKVSFITERIIFNCFGDNCRSTDPSLDLEVFSSVAFSDISETKSILDKSRLSPKIESFFWPLHQIFMEDKLFWDYISFLPTGNAASLLFSYVDISILLVLELYIFGFLIN